MGNNNKHIRGISPKNGDAHRQDHEAWTRRNFMSTVGIGGSLSFLFNNIPVVGLASSPLHAAIAAAESDRILVLVRLGGGNDGLNTIVPLYDYDTYSSNRPSLAIPETSVLALDNQTDFGLHPSMQAAQTMWNEGSMKAIHGIGYNNMSLSHFQGADIWATGRLLNTGDQSGTGFIGGVLDDEYPEYLVNPPAIPPAIFIGTGKDIILSGEETRMGLSLNDVEQFYNMAQTGEVHNTNFNPNCYHQEQLLFARSIANSTYTYSEVINTAYLAASNDVQYINFQNVDAYLPSFDKELAIIARLIKGNLGTKIYLVELNGFDTHEGQEGFHDLLLEQLSENMGLFFQDLAGANCQEKVIAMTISEFGRRIKDTSQESGAAVGNAGTDHGEAAPMMLFGPALAGNGFAGTHPDLSDSLANNYGNLSHTTDFRSVYATVLENWLCVNSAVIDATLGGSFDRIDGLVPTCNELAGCPPELSVNGTIATGTYQAGNRIDSDGTITTGNDVQFKAGESILLEEGFSIETASPFSAEIEGCGEN